MDTTIETQQLVKQYGKVTAVDGLSLRVAQGEIYAFLGLNGAGVEHQAHGYWQSK